MTAVSRNGGGGLRRSCNLRILCFAMVVLIVYVCMLIWISNYVFAISYNEGYTTTFLPPPQSAPDNNLQTDYTFVAHEIAIKWKLTSADGYGLNNNSTKSMITTQILISCILITYQRREAHQYLTY